MIIKRFSDALSFIAWWYQTYINSDFFTVQNEIEKKSITNNYQRSIINSIITVTPNILIDRLFLCTGSNIHAINTAGNTIQYPAGYLPNLISDPSPFCTAKTAQVLNLTALVIYKEKIRKIIILPIMSIFWPY